jgi:hypothetical protein
MGNCIYCGQAAGFLRRAHKECKRRYKEGKSKIIGLVSASNDPAGPCYRYGWLLRSSESTCPGRSSHRLHRTAQAKPS